jgi:hypothetical protein
MEQAAGSGAVDRTRALYERSVLGVQDEPNFREVRNSVEARLSEAGARDFLRTLDKAGLRIRDFETVLASGKLGSATPAHYAKLSPGDQGQIRELYLALLEQVPLSLRDKFFKLYAYY